MRNVKINEERPLQKGTSEEDFPLPTCYRYQDEFNQTSISQRFFTICQQISAATLFSGSQRAASELSLSELRGSRLVNIAIV